MKTLALVLSTFAVCFALGADSGEEQKCPANAKEWDRVRDKMIGLVQQGGPAKDFTGIDALLRGIGHCLSAMPEDAKKCMKRTLDLKDFNREFTKAETDGWRKTALPKYFSENRQALEIPKEITAAALTDSLSTTIPPMLRAFSKRRFRCGT